MAIAWSKAKEETISKRMGFSAIRSTAVDTPLEIESLEITIREGVMTISPKHSTEWNSKNAEE